MSTPTPAPALSVLDLVPVRTGQTSAQAVAAALSLAETADRLGLRRYWFAEHHNMPSVGSTTPPVLIAAAAARTSRIRVGSGGVMLPNHAPLIVAEQFAALEALAPGRIDLGIGRAPGSDPVITQLLRMSGTSSDVERFPQHVEDILALVSPEGATLTFTSGGTYDVHATPAAVSAPEVWLLGSSDYSAQLAASMGLPYVFANHFAGEGLERALGLYRGQYRPSEAHPEPVTFLTANVVAADTAEEADARALPQLRAMARLRLNRPMGPMETVEAALAAAPDDAMTPLIDAMRERWIIGTGEQAASDLRTLAHAHGVDEIMVSPIAAAREDEPMDAPTGRDRTLELLAAALAG
ncbi:LLM class flavin-dependent oxidoreductase [Microbacterium sp. zg-Y818]|uniref:LLM class flavin-dependent oxidoreductase n=1 Tax=unclassified Microbacterium TaxID=2609290 RepID=UPI00214CB468|nr:MULTISPECIES: LLM class flavin-dependent oxidoreductase [unclassified Microbacterium]MCR2800071.1 LLM class flavin-dependent oxidoreductase [Microbacterium sp. zg.Y818]WIM22046.1 LLM class flavin-dependent oxidoreductase [Microbacterium sp. zg-Y818]